ncbi:MAG: FYDLN acid domain-containing protein [Alphaproteobacteria bacterium]|nr:FYDLN acid domain-containing protein [Alphaproteobacteria bacterium]
MGTVDARGTKRTCQNNDCGARFYDLNNDPIICPLCEAPYVIAHAPAGAVIPEEPKPKDPKLQADGEESEEKAAEDGDLADIETDDTIPDDDDDSDTFLETEEDDDGNVKAIVPGIAEGKEEDS